MKNKLLIGILVILLLTVIFFMLSDFFGQDESRKNPYEYSFNNLDFVDSSQVEYKEVGQIKPDIEDMYGICFDEEDNLYVAGLNKVIIYNSANELVNSFVTGKEAWCIDIHPSGKLFIGMHDHVEIWDTIGNLLASWKPESEESILTSIAVSDSSVFVADVGEKIVYRYTLQGELVKRIGAKDSVQGIPGFLIRSPYFDLLIGRDNELWVVNPGLYSLEAYDFNGNLKSSWAKPSTGLDGFCGCCNPVHFALLSNGSFVTSEKGIERVKIHLPNGDFKCVVAPPDAFEKGTKDLDLAVDSRDRIFVLDPVKMLIRIFENKEK